MCLIYLHLDQRLIFFANSYGLGSTFIYAFGRHLFVSGDVNYSWTFSDLLATNVGVVSASGRVGEHWDLGKKRDKKLAVYVGFLYRNFTNTDGTKGNINLADVFPELQIQVDNKINTSVAVNTQTIAENDALIATLNPRSDALQIAGLKVDNGLLTTKNNALSTMQDTLVQSGVYTTEIVYDIKKEIIQKWTFEFGASFEFNPHLGFRSEIGVSKDQKLILVGLNYRFGI